jgi:hypothetical protein
VPDHELGRLDPISGRAGEVCVTLTGMTFRETNRGRRFPYPDFGSDFIGPLHDGLISPRRRGLLGFGSACAWCNAPLDRVPRQPVTASADVVLKRVPPIRVDVEMPGLVCPACSRAMVMINDRTVESDLSDALIAAFDSVAIAPG